MAPRDLDFGTMAMTVNPQAEPGISSLRCQTSWRQRLRGAHVALADGSAWFLPTSTPADAVRANHEG